MELTDNVYVMSEMTWGLWEMHLFERVSKVKHPLTYLKLISMIDVLIDNSLPNFTIEVYNKSDDDYVSGETDEYWWDK